MVPDKRRLLDDPEHWRSRAEEVRTLLDMMRDEPSRETMLRIALDYERLAERAEQRMRDLRNGRVP